MFMLLEKVDCGNGITVPSCHLCPKTNDTLIHSWCDGNCFYDEEMETCRECKSLCYSQIILRRTLWLNEFCAHVFKLSNFIPFEISDQYEKMEGGYSCSIERKKKGNLILAKKACDRDVTCLGFMTIGKQHHMCTNSTRIQASRIVSQHSLSIKRNNEGKNILIS